MTKFTFFKHDGIFYGFEEEGHTGFGEAGDDILCAAVSAMTMLIINTIEVSFASDITYDIDENSTNIKVVAHDALPENCSDEKKRFAVAGLIQGYFYQLSDMLEEYYEYLDVTEKEI